MPQIPIDVETLPDRLPSPPIGEYVGDIDDIKEDESKEGKWIAVLVVREAPEDEWIGKKVMDRMDFEYAPARIKFGHFCRAAGFTEGRPDTSDLIGCTVKWVQKQNNYMKNGELVEGTQVGAYVHD